jgi:hypothetical protein
MGLWNRIKDGFKSVGKFVKKNWKTILGVAAAVAIPFAAPAIGGLLAGSAFLSSVAPGVASFLGGSLGSGLIGAGLGAGAAALTGQNPLLGAALGGVGGFAGAAGGLGGMFGGIGGGAAPAGSAAFVPATGGLIDIGGATVNAATGLAAGGAAATGGLTGGLTGTLGSIGSALAANPKAIGALGQLAMVMFNKDMTELTPEEEAQLKEVAEQAATNRGLFNQQVEEARRMIQSGTPNPEQAYANARFSADAQLDEARRGIPVGLQEAAERKGAIESTKAGLQNVALDYASSMDRRRAGVQAMPDGAPTGYAQLAMPTYNSMYERQNDYDEQMSKAVGNLFGSLA